MTGRTGSVPSIGTNAWTQSSPWSVLTVLPGKPDAATTSGWPATNARASTSGNPPGSSKNPTMASKSAPYRAGCDVTSRMVTAPAATATSTATAAAMPPTADRMGTPAPRRTPRSAIVTPAPIGGGPGTATPTPSARADARRTVGTTPAAITSSTTAGSPTASTTQSTESPCSHGPRRPMPIGPSALGTDDGGRAHDHRDPRGDRPPHRCCRRQVSAGRAEGDQRVAIIRLAPGLPSDGLGDEEAGDDGRGEGDAGRGVRLVAGRLPGRLDQRRVHGVGDVEDPTRQPLAERGDERLGIIVDESHTHRVAAAQHVVAVGR